MANDFTWHKVSEKEKEGIKKDSKKLLDNFNSKLAGVKISESHFESGDGTREEGEPWKTDGEFRDLFLLNAPFADKDFIFAEKGGWKK